MNIAVLGIDLGKMVCSLAGVDGIRQTSEAEVRRMTGEIRLRIQKATGYLVRAGHSSITLRPVIPRPRSFWNGQRLKMR